MSNQRTFALQGEGSTTGESLHRLIGFAERLVPILEEAYRLEREMKPHAVYSTEGMKEAISGLAHARNGLAQSIGYAICNEIREGWRNDAGHE